MIKNKKKNPANIMPGYLLVHLAGKIIQAEYGGTHMQSQHSGD